MSRKQQLSSKKLPSRHLQQLRRPLQRGKYKRSHLEKLTLSVLTSKEEPPTDTSNATSNTSASSASASSASSSITDVSRTPSQQDYTNRCILEAIDRIGAREKRLLRSAKRQRRRVAANRPPIDLRLREINALWNTPYNAPTPAPTPASSKPVESRGKEERGASFAYLSSMTRLVDAESPSRGGASRRVCDGELGRSPSKARDRSKVTTNESKGGSYNGRSKNISSRGRGSSVGSSRVGRSSVGSSRGHGSSVGSSRVGRISVGSSRVGRSSVGRSSVGSSSVGSSSIGRSSGYNRERRSIGYSNGKRDKFRSSNGSSEECSSVGSSSVGRSSVGSSSVGSSSIGSSSVGSSEGSVRPYRGGACCKSEDINSGCSCNERACGNACSCYQRVSSNNYKCCCVINSSVSSSSNSGVNNNSSNGSISLKEKCKAPFGCIRKRSLSYQSSISPTRSRSNSISTYHGGHIRYASHSTDSECDKKSSKSVTFADGGKPKKRNEKMRIKRMENCKSEKKNKIEKENPVKRKLESKKMNSISKCNIIDCVMSKHYSISKPCDYYARLPKESGTKCEMQQKCEKSMNRQNKINLDSNFKVRRSKRIYNQRMNLKYTDDSANLRVRKKITKPL